MAEYQWATNSGEIVIADYDRASVLNSQQVEIELVQAFESIGKSVEILHKDEDLSEVYKIQISNLNEVEKVYISAKGTTPGGRNNLKNEQRIQQKAKYLNYVHNKKELGEIAISLGVYKKDDALVFCAWRLAHSNAASPETPISKQIKIETIAKALSEGFVQQDKGNGEYACAFRKEFIYFYVRNSDWLHTGIVQEFAQHIPATPDGETEETIMYEFNTNLESEFSRNRILFGAPGTGKSYTLNIEQNQLLVNGGSFERVTFHPDYSYAQFVGTYKPIPSVNEDGQDIITYEYVPGPFTRILVSALKSSILEEPKPYLLIVEEINRANVTAVFGDVFQLLDRNDDEVSEYSIQTSEDMRKYLAKEIGGESQDYSEIKLPNNMFIWATMNSADQGVFPMDTAFKRRWDFTYIGINKSETGISDKTVILGAGTYARLVNWNNLRKAINNELLTYKVNEDKLMGPYFISKKILGNNDEIDAEKFINTFKNKILMYLFDDAAKQKRTTLFSGCEVSNLYSEICREFETKGVSIFCESIRNSFTDLPPKNAPQGE